MSTLNRTGNWIMLIKPVAIEIPVDRLAIYYAKPAGDYLKGCREIRFGNVLRKRAMRLNIPLSDYSDFVIKHLNGDAKSINSKWVREEIEFEVSRYNYTKDDIVSAAEIVTPFGAAKIWPEEYNQVSLDYALNLVNEESHIIRYLDNAGKVQDSMKQTSISDKVFYLRSRGIRFNEAMKSVSGEIKTQYLMYFDSLPQYIHTFERNFMEIAKRKQEYCRENGFEELLNYKATEDGEVVRFTLQDYFDHVEKKQLQAGAKSKFETEQSL